MGAAFDDFPLAEDEEGNGVADGEKAVGDDETGAAFHETFECFIDKPLAFGAKGGGGFVEQEDAGIGQNGAGDGDALALAAGQLGAARADDDGEAFRNFTICLSQ